MSIFDLTAALARAPINPESYQRVGLDFLTSKLDSGDSLTDVNNPLINLLEASSSQSAYHIQESFALDRRHYPLLSQGYDQLYGHMADADFLDRFATPGKAVIQYSVHLESLLAAMVDVPDTNIRRVIIPRYTVIRPNGGYALTLLYPIEIRQLPHDGLQVVFNTDVTTPIQTLSDNVLTTRYIRSNTEDQDLYLQLDIPLYQLARDSQIEEIIDGSSRFAFSFVDSFFYIRVFQGSSGNWSELATTHSLQVYDASTPTAVIQVGDGVVNVTIPPIYYTSNVVSGNLRVDIYTTSGNITESLVNYDPAKYTWLWGKDADVPALDDYSTSVPNLPFAFTSLDTITGGSVGLTFAEQRERVIYNITASEENNPITPAQIEARLSRLGFDIVKSRDDITERLYLATSDMGTPPSSSFNSGIGVSINTLQTTIANLVKIQGVYDNGDRITISPSTVFSLNNGLLNLLDNTSRPEVLYKTPETLVNGLNQSSYAFTPYHYVLDSSEDTFALRPYYLENPQQLTRRFEKDNASLLIEVSTSGFNIARTTTGYRLTVTLTGGATYLAVAEANRHLQLAFIPDGETAYAYLNGTYMGTTGSTVVWAFDIVTNFDLDSSNNLLVTNFNLYDTEAKKLALPLQTDFMLLTVVSGDVDSGYQYSSIDGLLGTFLLPDDAKGVAEEFVTLKLGTSLDRLWAGARTVAGSYEYQKYADDVLAYYTEDIYERDANGIPVYTVVDGEVVLVVTHKAGDQKFDADGAPILLHAKGDTVLDAYGEPVPVSSRPVTRLIDLLIFDGNYVYVTQTSDLTDLSWSADNLANTQLVQLDNLGKSVLEKTNVYLYPKKTIGSIAVIIDEGIEKQIESTLTFGIKFYLNGTAYRDTEYREALQTLTAKVLNTGIRQDTISVSALISLLKPEFDENVIGFDLSMYSNGTEMTTFTVSDASVQPSIDRIIEYTQDGKYAVKENIDFVFKNHDKKTT